MKNFLLRRGLLTLLLTGVCLLGRAQTEPAPPDSGRIRLAHTYEALLADPRLTTGRLLDAALPLADPTPFDGTQQAPATTTQTWRTAYATLLMAGGPHQPYPLVPLGEIHRRLDAQPQRLFDDNGEARPLLDLLVAVVPADSKQ